MTPPPPWPARFGPPHREQQAASGGQQQPGQQQPGQQQHPQFHRPLPPLPQPPQPSQPPPPPPSRRPPPPLASYQNAPAQQTAPRYNQPSPGLPARSRPMPPPPRMTDYFDGSQLLDSSSESDDFKPTSKRPPRPRPHARSMSHPFPSLFSKKKKQPSPHRGRDLRSSDDSDSDDDFASMSTSSKPPGARHSPQKKHAPQSSRDLTTGNCMTCGSLVRWPRDLAVFKCTICLTINDLKPLTPREPVPGRSREEPMSHHDKPISVEHTKLLVRQCLRSFILVFLANDRNECSTQCPQRSPFAPPNNSPWTGLDAPVTENNDRDSMVFPANFPSDLVDSPLEIPNPFNSENALPPRSYSSSYDQRPRMDAFARQPTRLNNCIAASQADGDPRKIFKPLEDYLLLCLTSWRCLNSSFGGPRPSNPHLRQTEDVRRRPPERTPERAPELSRSRTNGPGPANAEGPIAELDAKLLLLGDFAENGAWWTGGQEEVPRTKTWPLARPEETPPATATKTPGVDWTEMEEWYSSVVNAGQPWKVVYDGLVAGGQLTPVSEADLRRLESQILLGQDHAQKTLLKATETILKRPGRPLSEPNDLRFLLLILSNPLLAARCRSFAGLMVREKNGVRGENEPTRCTGPASGQHSNIIKRILGLISNSSNDCHNQLISWLSRFPESRFADMKDFVSGFMAYRLIRQNEKKHEVKFDVTDGLIPNVSAGRSAAMLHAALGPSSGSASKKPNKDRPKRILVYDDWQVKAAARVMTLIFAANNLHYTKRIGHCDDSMQLKGRVQARGQLLPTSDFYMALLDDSELTADFEAWETKRAKFSFCQYPFLLSVWAKIQILEHDAKRQMDKKARDAFFNSIMSRRSFDQYLYLNVRRDCLVEDSLKAVSEVIGSGGEDIKKGIRITFRGEEGVDAGGLRKEWFLLLVREVFNPDHGLFVYDEDSQYCYFNPNSFETSDQYFLVGVVFGLAIYNSTILDVALPPFAFRKLLAAAPLASGTAAAHSRPPMSYTLDDLAEFRPRLAKGLRQLLEFDGDVETAFCQDFAIDVDKYGAVERVPLVPGGERRAVTNANRREYVDVYVRYLLDSAVARQFDPFKRGFFTVCGGNALSLFRPEEIELLVRGSDETLDIASLRTAAEYDGWGKTGPPEETEQTVRWFWETFEKATTGEQTKLLTFITGSDRIPAMGAASLVIKVVCLGDDCGRYPTARTCFNTLALWRYETREKLERMLWGAVHESEGFGLK